MWGLLGSYANIVKAGLIVSALCLVFFAGWHMRDRDFTVYKTAIQVAAEKQQAQTESIQKQHELVTKGISDEYEAKLVAVRNYYKSTSMWNKSSSSTVHGISTAPSVTDVITAYNELAGNCSQTTLMLVELQKWLNEQIGIK
jgi:hypothetical protein